MSLSFIPSVTSPSEASPAIWFVFRGSDLLVIDEGETAVLPTHCDSLELLRQHYLGQIDGETAVHCFTAEVDAETEAPEGMQFVGLRPLYNRLSTDYLRLAGRAVQIIDWDRNHQFCSRCATPNEILSYERAKKCPNCGLVTYPRISPAMIVRVDRMIDGVPHLLLARNGRWKRGWYSVLAGFVEPGETLKECVHREVLEEVGIRVKHVRYFGSQPWPFPNSLMVAFTAEYAGGELVLEEAEIEDAGWYHADNLPNLPSRISIARRMVDDFLGQRAGKQ